MKTLYELTSDFTKVLDLMADDETDMTVITDTLDSIKDTMDIKIDNCATVIKELEAQRDKFKAEAETKQQMAKTMDKRVNYLRALIKMAMEETNQEKISTDHYTFRTSRNGGVQPLKIKKIADLSPEYTLQETVANKEKIRKALEDGIEVKGAMLVPRGSHITIK